MKELTIKRICFKLEIRIMLKIFIVMELRLRNLFIKYVRRTACPEATAISHKGKTEGCSLGYICMYVYMYSEAMEQLLANSIVSNPEHSRCDTSYHSCLNRGR